MSAARTLIAVALMGGVFLPHGSHAQPVEDLVLAEDMTVVEVDELADPYIGIVWRSNRIGRKGAERIRLRLSGFEIPLGSSFDVEIVAEDGTVLETFKKSSLERRSIAWTKVLPVSWIYVRIRADSKPEGLRFKIDQMAYSLSIVAGTLSKVGRDNREDMYKIEDSDLLRVARAVGKISYLKNGKRPRSCTGFLISGNLFVTNEHCIVDQQTCETAVAWFGYQKKSRTQIEMGEQFHCAQLIRKCHSLDYALIKLEGHPGDVFGQLEVESRTLAKTDKLVLIQHPGGKPKMVSRDPKCAVVTEKGDGRAVGTDFGYGCDTEDGSSGSPVLFAKSFKVVGLHHYRGATSGAWAGQNRGVRMELLAPHLSLNEPPESPLCPKLESTILPSSGD